MCFNFATLCGNNPCLNESAPALFRGLQKVTRERNCMALCQVSGILSKLCDFTQKWAITCITSKCIRCTHSTSCESTIWSLLLPKHKSICHFQLTTGPCTCSVKFSANQCLHSWRHRQDFFVVRTLNGRLLSQFLLFLCPHLKVTMELMDTWEDDKEQKCKPSHERKI